MVPIAKSPDLASGGGGICCFAVVERLQEGRDEAGIAAACITPGRAGSPAHTRAFYSANTGEPGAIACSDTHNQRAARNLAFGLSGALAGRGELRRLFRAATGFSVCQSDRHI
jgi:hypothetical protein